MPAFCSTCGSAMEGAARFCASCGAPISGFSVAPAETHARPGGSRKAELEVCPKCGGYKVSKVGPAFEFKVALLIGVISGFGLGLFLTIPLWAVVKLFETPERREKAKFGRKCSICGYQWLQRPGEVLPIADNPELRRKGEIQLEQEALAAAWYAQQQRDRDRQ